MQRELSWGAGPEAAGGELDDDDCGPMSMADAGREAVFRCQVAACAFVGSSLHECDVHYDLVHRHACSECKSTFPSERLLEFHLLERHDPFFQSLAATRPMYQCLVEGMGVAVCACCVPARYG